MVRPRAEWSAVVASSDAVRAVVVRQQVARWVAVENWRVAPSSSSGVVVRMARLAVAVVELHTVIRQVAVTVGRA